MITINVPKNQNDSYETLGVLAPGSPVQRNA